MARTRLKLLSPGMRDLLNDARIRDVLTSHAGPILARARAGAPVESGRYLGSLRIIQDTTDRAVVRVGSNDPDAMVIESKTGNLARAVNR